MYVFTIQLSRSGCFLANRSILSSVSIGGLESLRNSSKSSGFGFCRLVTAAAMESAQCVRGCADIGLFTSIL